jgi:rhodanese-related sulfurtransferase
MTNPTTMGPGSPGAEPTLEEVRRRAGTSGFTLVDVLPAASYEEGHLPGAWSLPVADIPSRARALLPDLDADIVVYCGGPT